MSIWLPVIVLILPVASLILRSPRVITKLGPNPFIGIRTATTLDNRNAWELVHTRSWPYARVANLVLLGVLMTVIGWASLTSADAQDQVVGIGTSLGIIAWFSLNLVGTRAALHALNEDPPAQEPER